MSFAEFRARKALAHYAAMLQMARAQKHYPIVLAEAIDASK